MLTKQANELIGKRVRIRGLGVVDTVTLDGVDASVRVMLEGGAELTVPDYMVRVVECTCDPANEACSECAG